MNLPTLPADKANHVLYGQAIALSFAALARALGHNPAAWAVAGAAIFGIGKELLDRLANRRAIKAGLPPPHGVEFADFAATLLGGASVGAVLALPAL